jgi:hypothetical protein
MEWNLRPAIPVQRSNQLSYREQLSSSNPKFMYTRQISIYKTLHLLVLWSEMTKIFTHTPSIGITLLYIDIHELVVRARQLHVSL